MTRDVKPLAQEPRKFCPHCEEVEVAAPGTMCTGNYEGYCRAKRCTCGALTVGWTRCQGCKGPLPVFLKHLQVRLPDDLGQRGGKLEAVTVDVLVDFPTGNVWLTKNAYQRVEHSQRRAGFGGAPLLARQTLGDAVRVLGCHVVHLIGTFSKAPVTSPVRDIETPGPAKEGIVVQTERFEAPQWLDLEIVALDYLGSPAPPEVPIKVWDLEKALESLYVLRHHRDWSAATSREQLLEEVDGCLDKLRDAASGALTKKGHGFPLYLDQDACRLARLLGREHLRRETLAFWPASTFAPVEGATR